MRHRQSPAIQAVMKHATLPAIRALRPQLEMSARLSGAMAAARKTPSDHGESWRVSKGFIARDRVCSLLGAFYVFVIWQCYLLVDETSHRWMEAAFLQHHWLWSRLRKWGDLISCASAFIKHDEYFWCVSLVWARTTTVYWSSEDIIL